LTLPAVGALHACLLMPHICCGLPHLHQQQHGPLGPCLAGLTVPTPTQTPTHLNTSGLYTTTGSSMWPKWPGHML
jgi:hypothetical protein